MELQVVTLNGFRRFSEATEVRTNGKLVALLGPNEAGKTSILMAIRSLGTSDPIEKKDLTRGQEIDSDQTVLSAKFRLDDADLKAAGLLTPTWFALNKKADGSRTYSFSPKIPKRDISARTKLSIRLDQIRSNNKLWGRLVQSDENTISTFDDADISLKSTQETLTPQQIQNLLNLVEFVRDKSAPRDPNYFCKFPNDLLHHIELEQSDTPEQFAKKTIFARMPKILFFSNDDRLLEGSYHIDNLSESIPAALDNLANVANLDLKRLIEAVNDDDTPIIAKLKDKANDELRARFDKVWSQSGVHVAFDVHNREIQVLVREENYEYTKLAERSDGLRQFVALQCFTTRERAENPILLIDEAEIRLHYDAQADLIHMLSSQNVSSKIIYTTHSAGCLPEDLGNGVRLVDYAYGETGAAISRVKNRFWDRGQGGLEPLLYGMGAATLAFFPIRRALLTEGESDMLLLPTMLREAYGTDSLTFQVVPGLSKTSGINLPILARNGTGVAFALDFDGGGRALEKKIADANFDKNSVFFLKGSTSNDWQIEDFLNPHALAHGAIEAFRELGSSVSPIRVNKLREHGRLDTIRAHYKIPRRESLPKTLIAYFALEYAINHPDQPFVDQKKLKAFQGFAEAVRAYLSRPSPS